MGICEGDDVEIGCIGFYFVPGAPGEAHTIVGTHCGPDGLGMERIDALGSDDDVVQASPGCRSKQRPHVARVTDAIEHHHHRLD